MSNQSNGIDKNNETTTQLVIMLQEQMTINQKQLQVNEALAQEVKLIFIKMIYTSFEFPEFFVYIFILKTIKKS